jgi:hypothetical protein
MLDIEFISELSIALLHGPQNKKASLDKWYEAYEREFADRERVERVFATVLGELTQVLPFISMTRWRKKSDFYSLFEVLAEHEARLPLTKTGRQKANRVLEDLGKAVDGYLGRGVMADGNVRKYSHAVERAASDLSNRKTRLEVLNSVLADLW